MKAEDLWERRETEAKRVQGHIGRLWQSQDLNPDLLRIQSNASAERSSPLTSVRPLRIYTGITVQNLAHKTFLSRADNHSLGVLIKDEQTELQWFVFTFRFVICMFIFRTGTPDS